MVQRYGADVDGCSGEVLGVARVRKDVAGCRETSRPAGMLSGARMSGPGLVTNFISLIHEGWFTRARERRGNVRPT